MSITISGNGIVEANLADNAVTLAKMASGTDGEILTYDASGNPVAVSVGTDGQVLTSTGAGSPPAFETAAGGKVLQVIQDVKTDIYSSSTAQVITGLSVSITPSLTTSKILIIAQLSTGGGITERLGLKLYNNSAAIFIGDAGGSRVRSTLGGRLENNTSITSHNISYLHEPSSTASQTYEVWIDSESTAYINRSAEDGDSSSQYRPTSSIIVMEIGA